MAQNDLIIMAVAVLIVGVILYKQINKVTQNITNDDENPNLAYSKFCDAIDKQIDILRQNTQEDMILEPNKKASSISSFLLGSNIISSWVF